LASPNITLTVPTSVFAADGAAILLSSLYFQQYQNAQTYSARTDPI
jgi:hypothetical protein